MSIAQNFPEIKPSLNLSFALTKQLDPRITFARASTGTYWDGKTYAKAEENLLQYSQEFDNAYWGKYDVTITANADTAPDGTTTADTITFTTSATSRMERVVSVISGETYTFSVWMRVASGTFDVKIGDISSSTVVQTVTDSWQRFSVTQVASSATRYPKIVGNGAAGSVYIWGAQLEQRSAVSSYTPTTTQPITRYQPALQTAASGVARFDHNPVTQESLGLLVEEQRTNLLTYSEQFDNAAWTKSNATVTADTVVAPDGTLTGDKIVENTSNSTHLIYAGTQSFTSGTSYTASLYAKSAGRRYLILQFPTAAFGANSLAFFDLELGTFTLGLGLTTASIEAVGNGVYRCAITKTATSTATSNAIFIQLSNTATVNAYTGDGYSGIYIWGAQLEAGAFPTSYIPTVASQVTRSADAASMTGTNFSEWYNAGEGTLYGEAKGFGAGTSNSTALFQIDNGSSNNRITLASDDVTNASGLVVVNGVIQASFTSSFTADYNKGCLTYKVNDVAYSLNGSTAATDTNTLLPVVDQMRICSNTSGTSNFTIKKIAYYPLRLSNANLQALTGS